MDAPGVPLPAVQCCRGMVCSAAAAAGFAALTFPHTFQAAGAAAWSGRVCAPGSESSRCQSDFVPGQLAKLALPAGPE